MRSPGSGIGSMSIEGTPNHYAGAAPRLGGGAAAGTRVS